MEILPNLYNFKVNNISNVQKQTTAFKGAVIKDSVEFSGNTAKTTNEKLHSIYGINSTIQNPKLAQLVFEAVEDFCRVNENTNLFKNLKINEDEIEENFKYNEKEKTLSFKRYTDFSKTAKELYDAGEILSDNHKYLIYQSLGEFLNENNDPKNYSFFKKYRVECGAIPMEHQRFFNSKYFNEYNSNYIASRMCGVDTLELGEMLYTGNRNLKFPAIEETAKNKPEPFIKNVKNSSYNDLARAMDYVEREYGIYAWFKNANMANDFISAVEKLTKAAGDKTIFKGLEFMEGDGRIFQALDKNTKEGNTMCYSLGNQLTYNPLCNWDENNAPAKYKSGFHSTPNSEHIWLHELSHFLERKVIGNNDPGREFTYNERLLAAKVSGYASCEVHEFCAEYLSAKAQGVQYPKAIDDLFKKHWLGCELKF